MDKGAHGPETEPDLALRLWLDALGEQRRETLLASLGSVENNSQNRRRLWLQVIKEENHVDKDFLLEIIPRLSSMPDNDETVEAVFGDDDHVTKVVSSADDQAKLAQGLMQAYANLSSDDLDILRGHFGGSKTFRKIEKVKKT